MATDDPRAHDADGEARSHLEHRRIQRILQAGLVLGGAAMLAGLAIAIAAAIAHGEPLHRGGLGSTIMRAGIIALALTPVVRVVALVGLWVRERDWRFAVVGAVVMLILLAAIVSGHGG